MYAARPRWDCLILVMLMFLARLRDSPADFSSTATISSASNRLASLSTFSGSVSTVPGGGNSVGRLIVFLPRWS